MSTWNRNQVASFFPSLSNSHTHRGLGSDWRMNIAFPPVNINKKEKEFQISLATPGYIKEDFKIESKEGRLIVSATHRKSKEEQTDEYIHREYDVMSFEREIVLPLNAVEEEIKAKYENGMLNITIPRNESDNETPSVKISVE